MRIGFTHLQLARAYAAQQDYEKAADRLLRAVELAKNDGARTSLPPAISGSASNVAVKKTKRPEA